MPIADEMFQSQRSKVIFNNHLQIVILSLVFSPWWVPPAVYNGVCYISMMLCQGLLVLKIYLQLHIACGGLNFSYLSLVSHITVK